MTLSLSVGVWAPPMASPSSGQPTTRKSTPIPPKRTFSGPLADTAPEDSREPSQQRKGAMSLSPFCMSPPLASRFMLLGSSTAGVTTTAESAAHKLGVPASTPNAAFVSPGSTPPLSLRHCLPLAASPAATARRLPSAPPTSPAISLLDRLTRSAAFRALVSKQQQQVGELASEEEEDGNPMAFTASDEKRHSLSSSGRGMDWMPVLVE